LNAGRVVGGADALPVEHPTAIDGPEKKAAVAIAGHQLDLARHIRGPSGSDHWRVDSRIPTVNRSE
jgi:hypothetical protein